MRVIRLFFALAVAFVMAQGTACGQFWHWENEIYFRLQNDSGRVIPGATVYLNGVKMEYSETCGNFGDHTCYRCPKMELSGHYYLSISHPQYQPFADSMTLAAEVHLFRPDDSDYYYDYLKVPYKKTPDAYVCNMRIRDSIAPVQRRIEAAGGRIIKEFSQCGGFKQYEYGPYSLLYVLPRNDSTEALHRYLGRAFDTGPWVKQPYHSVAVANHFSMYVRPADLPQAQQLLEQMKSDSVIKYFSITPAGLSQITIYLDKGDEHRVQPLIEQLLKTKIFCDPVMGFYMYDCLE